MNKPQELDFFSFRKKVLEGRTYEEISFALDVSRSAVSNRLNGQTDIKTKEFIRWCNTFNLDPHEFIVDAD